MARPTTSTSESIKTLPDGTIETTTQDTTEGKLANFIKLLGVGIAASSGLMAVVASLYNLRQNALQQVRQEELQIQLEKLRASLPQERSAYHNLFRAADYYYRVLSRLESGIWDAALVREADNEMEKARADTVFIPEDHKELWMDFFQKARGLSEKVLKLQRKDSESLKQLWLKEVKRLGDSIMKFQEIARYELTPS